MNQCKRCGKPIISKWSTTSRKFCGIECFYADSKESRKGTNNPNFRGGIWAKETGEFRYGSKTAGKHLRACMKYKRAFVEKHGFMFCELCRVNQTYKFSVHHIYYASRFPKHPSLHDDRNL